MTRRFPSSLPDIVLVPPQPFHLIKYLNAPFRIFLC